MAQAKNSTDLTELLLKCVGEPDPMLSMLEWLCTQLMEAEVSGLTGAECTQRLSQRLPLRLPAPPAGYTYGDNVSYGTQAAGTRLYSVLRDGAQAQRGSPNPSCTRGFRARRIHPEDGETGA